MNTYEIYSLAIQALHERRDMISRTSKNAFAIKECEEAILFFEKAKRILCVAEFSDCSCNSSGISST